MSFELINITVVNQNFSSSNTQKRKNCTENFLQLYDGSTSLLNRKQHFCSSELNKFYKSQTNKVFLRYHLNKNSENDAVIFRLTYNPFTLGNLYQNQIKILF